MIDLGFLKPHQRLVAIDAETTGNPIMTAAQIRKAPKGFRPPGVMIEIGCVELLRTADGWRKGETWQTRINPDGPIQPQAIKIHGIKPAELKAAPRFADIAPDLLRYLGTAPLLAHAYRNEKQFLDYEMARAKLTSWDEEAFPDDRFVCTQEIYASLYPGAPKSLNAVSDRLWLDRSERFAFHGALLDADLTADAFVELERRIAAGPESEQPRSVDLG
jgi:DNA polymerase-3 subunit epsilon